ncbi:MAG TPA: hypothetical protein VIY47_04460 [Ignavibacteriaceae bacterium]
MDLISYEENDLGTYDNVEIQLKSGKTYRMKPENYEPPQKKGLFSWLSGYLPNTEPKPPKEIFLKDEEVILFFNNSAKTANLEEAQEIYLNDLWNLKEKIK